MAVKWDKKDKGAEGGTEVLVSHVQSKPAVAHTSVKHLDGSVQEKTESLGQVLSVQPLCNIGVQASQTIPVAPYQSIKIGVSLNMPCGAAELEDTYAFAKNWVDGKMQKLTEEVEQAKAGG